MPRAALGLRRLLQAPAPVAGRQYKAPRLIGLPYLRLARCLLPPTIGFGPGREQSIDDCHGVVVLWGSHTSSLVPALPCESDTLPPRLIVAPVPVEDPLTRPVDLPSQHSSSGTGRSPLLLWSYARERLMIATADSVDRKPAISLITP